MSRCITATISSRSNTCSVAFSGNGRSQRTEHVESNDGTAIQIVMPTTTRGEIGRELITNGFDQFQPQKTPLVKTFCLCRLKRCVQQFGGKWLRQSSGKLAKCLMAKTKDCGQPTTHERWRIQPSTERTLQSAALSVDDEFPSGHEHIDLRSNPGHSFAISLTRTQSPPSFDLSLEHPISNRQKRQLVGEIG